MSKSNKFLLEVRERAVRVVRERQYARRQGIRTVRAGEVIRSA